MFGHLLSIVPSEPELLIDISRASRANSDYSESGYPYIPNYGSSGGGAAYACVATNLKSPELYYNPWNLITLDLCEAVELKTGVWHVTKLLVTDSRNSILYLNLNNFVGFNSKISIFINKPTGRKNASDAAFSMGADNWADIPFSQTLTDGVNVIEIPESSVFDSQYANIARISIPDDWWDRDEDGNAIDTNTDFYVVFFPVYDQSKTVGYPTYALPDFTKSSWNELGSSNDASIINYYKVDTTACSEPFNFRYNTSTNLQYSTSNVFVIKPFKARFKRYDGGKNISVSIDLHGINNNEDVLIQTFVNSSSTGEITVDFPGAVVFSETSYTNPVVIIYVYPKGVYEQLPLETCFQFSKSISEGIEGHYCYAQIPESPNFGTVIMDMEVSSDIEPEVLTAAFYKDVDATLGGNGIRMAGPNNSTVSFGTEIAFTYGNSSQGKSYINGVLNTTNPTSEYFGKHITVANVGIPIEGSNVHYIGGSSIGGQSPFRLHKFMAFKEQLTEEQLKKVYEKYNFYMGN